MNTRKTIAFLALLAGPIGLIQAAPLTFTATGDPNVSGYVTFEDSGLLLNGTCESNTNITELDLTVTVGSETMVFSTGDVETGDSSVLISTGPLPQIQNGCGNLAISGGWTIGFWPDGWDGSPTDGDAALRVEGGDPADISYAVLWEVTEHTPSARFKVTKLFENGITDDVEVTLTCNSGLPLSQSFTITGGDPDGVTFVVTELPDSGATCTVTESGLLDNYTAEMNGGAGCTWENVTGGLYECEILNRPDDGTFSVTKQWVMDGETSKAVTMVADVQIRCSVSFDGASYDGLFYRDYVLTGETDTALATGVGTHRPDDANWCYAIETGAPQSGVETESDCGDGSDPHVIAPGADVTCTITNTVFYEGIPTLSQWGMALMALLMLGVGFIGFRRYA